MITSGRNTIGTVAAAIDGVHNSSSRITIHNNDNTNAVFLGGADVTVESGLALNKLETLQFDLAPLEQLYAVSTQAGHTVSFLRQVV